MSIAAVFNPVGNAYPCGLKKKEPGAGSIKKQLAELFPHYKTDEIDLLASITTKKELDQYLKLHGWNPK